MTGRDYLPGVPSAGHVATNGYWHPGGSGTCGKTPCREDRATPLAVGDGVVYHPRPGQPGQDGVVTKLGRDGAYVFVRYANQHPGADGQSTPVRMLTRTSGGSIRGGG